MVKTTADGAAKNNNYAVDPWFLLALIFFTSAVLSVIIYGPIKVFHTQDPYPPLVSLTPRKIIEFGGTPAPVDVGMFIHNFPEFDVVNGVFVTDATVWFRFDPKLISLDRISRFTFEKADFLKRNEPNTQLDGDLLLARFDVRVKFNIPFNYKAFPLDDHRLNFVLSNNLLAPSDATFKSSRSGFILSPGASAEGWRYVDRRVKFGYSVDKLDPADAKKNIYHPRVVFSIDYERVGTRYLISIFLPLLMIFYIALFSFALNPLTTDFYSIVSMSSAAITALIAYRFVIENMSPSTGYFMTSDYVFIYFLIASCIILVVNMFGLKVTRLMKQLIALCLHGMTIALFLYLLTPWR